MYFDLTKGFPIVTTREIRWGELIVPGVIGVLHGNLPAGNQPTENVIPDDIWGVWTPSPGVNYYTAQIKQAVEHIKNRLRENTGRTFVCLWNACDIPTRQPYLFQFSVREKKLFCSIFLKKYSVLDAPNVIAFCALLTEVVAQVCGIGGGGISLLGVDAYVPEHRKEKALQQTRRKPYPLPKLELNPRITTLGDFTPDDIKLIGYQFHSGGGIQGT